eukprot:CAMPEP_0176192626 /NCGR_PEP_ID=MMETSP0121_2-20121125/5068_1 /TAXON_ID=160619 /ORGANISM="Kryptoperidinium foliaceum, Strain CCMP 1326" /LENGTH=208 /DNA_ID=CAMNT_0017531319 /DNA_START=305 /DNA_END=928 /DNA_ORIENTATION=-
MGGTRCTNAPLEMRKSRDEPRTHGKLTWSTTTLSVEALAAATTLSSQRRLLRRARTEDTLLPASPQGAHFGGGQRRSWPILHPATGGHATGPSAQLRLVDEVGDRCHRRVLGGIAAAALVGLLAAVVDDRNGHQHRGLRSTGASAVCQSLPTGAHLRCDVNDGRIAEADRSTPNTGLAGGPRAEKAWWACVVRFVEEAAFERTSRRLV